MGNLFSVCKMKRAKTLNKILISSFFLAGFFLAGSSSAWARDMEEKPRVKLRSLDKITAQTMTFDARVGSTLKFGTLYMKVQSCQKTTPIDLPESSAFLQIWEVDPEEKAHWVFSGWMFASSPALSPMDHPVYDVWLLDCLDDEAPAENAASSQESPESAPADNPDTNGVVTGKHAQPQPGDLLE